MITFFFAWTISKATNFWVAQDWGSKSTRIGSTMTTLAMVQIPSLVSTMSIQQEELNVVEGSTCSCFFSTSKPTFHAMATKMSQIASQVFMCSLPWTQHKKWIPIRSMWCVHTHQGIPTIEGCDSPSHSWNVVEKTKKNNQNVKKNSQIVNQTPTPRLEDDKFVHNGFKIFCQRAC